MQIDSLLVPLVLQRLVHLFQKGDSLHRLQPGLCKTFLCGLGECLSLRSALLSTPLLPPVPELTELQPCLTSALADELQFRAGLRGFPTHVLPSQAVSRRSGLCCRQPIPAWLTPALHLIGFLFFFGCRNRCVNASTSLGLWGDSCCPFTSCSLQRTEMPPGWRILPLRHRSSSPC